MCKSSPCPYRAARGKGIQFSQQFNPPREKDALIDYREQRRTTPKEALIEINRLRQSGEVDGNPLLLLEDLENYIQKQFKLNTDQYGQTLIDFGQ